MAVTDTLTTSNTTVSGTVLNELSIVHVSGDFDGPILLEAAPTGTTNWIKILGFNKPECFLINTPDTTLLYRFNGEDLKSGEANVYLGA